MTILTPKPQCDNCVPELKQRCQDKVQNLSVELNHQLNTPLGVALTALTTLDNNLTNNPNSLKLSELQEGVKLALTSLNKSISYLNKFKQVTQPNINKEVEEINVQHTLNQVIEMVKCRYPSIDAKVNITCPSQMVIRSCSKIYHSIFENLIDNAYVHGFKNSTLPPELFINAIYDELTGNYYLMFKDNGVGIPELLQEKVLSPYYSTHPDKRTMGMGLNEVEHLITEVLGGKIAINSCQNKPGTVVKIVVPAPKDKGPT